MVNEKGFENYLLSVPKPYTAAALHVDKVEQINEDHFLLTYEVNKEETVTSINANHSVVLKGTNYTYPIVMGYRFMNGSFFTQSMQKQKSKNVVLNELAAFELFGNENIVKNKISWHGESFTIVGVIRDGDQENKNIYIPLEFLSESPTTILTPIDDKKGITEAYIKNELKEAGVMDSSHDFINVGEARRMTQELAIIAILLFFNAVLLLLVKSGMTSLMNSWKAMKDLLAQYYFTEILQKKPTTIYSLIGRFIYTAFCTSLIVYIAVTIFKICIDWNIDVNLFLELQFDSFMNKIQFMKYALLSSLLAFSTSVVVLILWFLSVCKNKTPRPNA